MSADQLTAPVRAFCFTKLTTLEQAGIPLLQALPIAAKESPPSLKEQFARLQVLLQRGEPLAEAGRRSGLFLPWEARLISVAVESGHLEATFARFAEHYTTHAQRQRQLGARFTLPVAVLVLVLALVLAIFVAPIPALFQGEIGIVGYLLRTLLPLAIAYFGCKNLAARYRQSGTHEQSEWLAELALAMPLLGGMLRRQQRHDFLAGLALLLEAGVPAVEALRLAGESVANTILRRQYTATADEVTSGATVSEALASCQVLDDNEAAALLDSGEVSGRLPETLRYYAGQVQDRLNLQTDYITEWLPRIFYFAVLGPAILL